MVAPYSCTPGSECATALAQSSSAGTVLCLFPLGSELQDGQHLCPLTILFIYRHNINWGCRDEKWHHAKHLPTQTVLCLQQGLCSVQWEGRWVHGAGFMTWGSQLVDQKAVTPLCG